MGKNFLICDFNFINKNLPNEMITRAYHSIGSHIFFKFGEEREEIFPHRKIFKVSDWTIWVGATSWRISKEGKYVIGSNDPPEQIHQVLQRFVGKRFLSMKVISQFLDLSIFFEEGYQVTTFLTYRDEDQWVIFFREKETDESRKTLGVDYKTVADRRGVQKIASSFSLSENYQKIDFFRKPPLLLEIARKGDMYCLLFENDLHLYLNNGMWRLEKDEELITTLFDGALKTRLKKLGGLVGSKLLQMGTVNPFMDAKFTFEGGYVLKTFSCLANKSPWKIRSKGKVIFEPDVPLLST